MNMSGIESDVASNIIPLIQFKTITVFIHGEHFNLDKSMIFGKFSRCNAVSPMKQRRQLLA